MTDRITLTGLRVRGRHGVYDFERENGQDFVVDAELVLDLSRPARTDEVTDTVHYGELADRLGAIVAGPPVRLIETLADRLAAACLADERVERVRLTVHKPQAPIAHGFTDVSVTLVRTRTDSPGRRDSADSPVRAGSPDRPGSDGSPGSEGSPGRHDSADPPGRAGRDEAPDRAGRDVGAGPYDGGGNDEGDRSRGSR